MIIEILFIATLGLCILHCYVRCGKTANLINKMRGPKAYPLLGNLPNYFVSNTEDLIPIIDNMNNNYYPIYRTWTLFYAITNILHPDDAKVILSHTSNIKKSVAYNFLKPWLSEGLLISKDAKWKNRRKILTPAFHFNILPKYMEVLSKHGIRIVDSLKGAEKEKIINLAPFMCTHTLNTICEAAMGVSLDSIELEEIKKYREAVHFMGKVVVYRLLHPWYIFDSVFSYLSPLGWKQRKALKILHNFSAKIINERKEYHEKTGGKYLNEFTNSDDALENNTTDIYVTKERLAMLDLLIVASRNGLIDDAGIQEEIDTFIFEGHDTSAMAICYALQLLAEHTEIQERARSEIDEMWKACDGQITMTEMNKLSYLERCMEESLRLYPAVPFISRKLVEDMQLKDYLIPASTIVHVFIYEIHRDPNFWPEPLKFDPDRFLPERCLGRHPFCYIPFSGGPRNCIGQRFAMLEMKTFTAYILRNFYLEAIDVHSKFKRTVDLTLRSLGPIRVRFVRRNE